MIHERMFSGPPDGLWGRGEGFEDMGKDIEDTISEPHYTFSVYMWTDHSSV